MSKSQSQDKAKVGRRKEKSSKKGVSRLSISLPDGLFQSLDQMIAERGFTNRSQAIAEMVQQSLLDYYQDNEDEVMAGLLTLIYDESKPGLLSELVRKQRNYLNEVISSNRILLEGECVMEVMVVQGPVKTLNEIRNAFMSCKGVFSGNLQLTSKLLPPLHERGKGPTKAK